MKLISVQRLKTAKDSTVGKMKLPGTDVDIYVIEDEKRKQKVAGETRIPAGLYKVKKRKADSPLTLKYREIYTDFFDYHLELQDVPDFKYVYIHHGNFEYNTDGCLLVNSGYYETEDGEYAGTRSRDAFRLVYKRISEMLNDGEEVFIEVLDEKV
jgi:hypothetical protein